MRAMTAWLRGLAIVAFGSVLSGCAATVPRELATARIAYQRASDGPAAQWTPAELHKAHEALGQAEQSFASDPDSFRTRDLAYVAERKAQMAEALANIAVEDANKKQASRDLDALQSGIVQQSQRELSRSRAQLADTQRQAAETRAALAAEQAEGHETEEHLALEKQARLDAEKRAADAQDALAKLASVKREPRGLVITLTGSVLFGSGQSALLPESRNRLDQVATALLTTKERNLVVEGHTDARGSESYNFDLSQRRAEAVRSFLIQSGYQPDKILARGMGKSHPIADNSTPEGRANNRRVEIIVVPNEMISRIDTSPAE